MESSSNGLLWNDKTSHIIKFYHQFNLKCLWSQILAYINDQIRNNFPGAYSKLASCGQKAYLKAGSYLIEKGEWIKFGGIIPKNDPFYLFKTGLFRQKAFWKAGSYLIEKGGWIKFGGNIPKNWPFLQMGGILDKLCGLTQKIDLVDG